MEAQQKAERDAANVDNAKDNYGVLPLVQSSERPGTKRIQIASLEGGQQEGSEVVFRARAHNARAQGAKMCFLVLRQQQHTIQAVIAASEDGAVSKQMVKWSAGINIESIVLVYGVVAKPAELVKSTTVQDAEIHIKKIYIISEAEEKLPLQIEDAARSEEESERLGLPVVGLATKLDHRVMDLRTTTNQAIFRISSGVCTLFKEFLLKENFVEIHTPKLNAAPTEGGANVFEVTYFEKKAYLAQSPQFYKQMLIAGDFEKVFEIGPVFRAENSNSHRHMTEVDLLVSLEF